MDAQHGEEQVTYIVAEDYPLMALSFGHEGEHTVPAFTDSDSIHAFIAHEGYEQYTVPRNDEQSKNTPDAEQWALARAEELASCRANSTWGELLHLPAGKKFVNLGFIYAIKKSAEGSSPRFKARLVYRNHPFIDSASWDEVFAPVIDKSSLRIFFTLAARNKYFMRQADVVTAYLNAAMNEEVYVKLPRVCGDDPTLVRRLFKALYGHPRAGQLWNKKFVDFMLSLGFIQSLRDKCLFVHVSHGIYVVLYVDDLLAAARTVKALNSFWKKLESTFKIRSMGTPTFFLGMDICYLQDQGILTLSQSSYIDELNDRFQVPFNERATTPIKPTYYADLQSSSDEPILTDLPYKELVGSLIYVMVCTRPDIAFCVSCLTTYFASPKRVHWELAVRCLGYLVATRNYGLILGTGGTPNLVCFSDSDWASNPVTRRSIGGHIILFGNSVIAWSSKTQKGILALSTTESEYIEMALAIRQVLYLQPIFSDFSVSQICKHTVVFGDNRPAISSLTNDSTKSRTKHIDVRLKFCGEVLRAGLLTVKYVPTATNIADLFTKPLPAARFRMLRDRMVKDVQVFIQNGSKATAKLLATMESMK